MRAYVLINTAPGEGYGVAAALDAASDARLSVLHADPVLGPYDEHVVRATPFVVRTVTCLSVHFA